MSRKFYTDHRFVDDWNPSTIENAECGMRMSARCANPAPTPTQPAVCRRAVCRLRPDHASMQQPRTGPRACAARAREATSWQGRMCRKTLLIQCGARRNSAHHMRSLRTCAISCKCSGPLSPVLISRELLGSGPQRCFTAVRAAAIRAGQQRQGLSGRHDSSRQ